MWTHESRRSAGHQDKCLLGPPLIRVFLLWWFVPLSPFNMFRNCGWGDTRGVGATGGAWAGSGGVKAHDTLKDVKCDPVVCSILWLHRSCISSRSSPCGLSINIFFFLVNVYSFFLYPVRVLPLLSSEGSTLLHWYECPMLPFFGVACLSWCIPYLYDR